MAVSLRGAMKVLEERLGHLKKRTTDYPSKSYIQAEISALEIVLDEVDEVLVAKAKRHKFLQETGKRAVLVKHQPTGYICFFGGDERLVDGERRLVLVPRNPILVKPEEIEHL
jgi:hypothetical protein